MRSLLAAAVLFSTTIASAQAPGSVAMPPPDLEPVPGLDVVPLPSERVTYRTDVHLADAASVLMILGGGFSGSPELSMVGVTTYFVGAPLVHLGHGQAGSAAKSLGLRVALPMVGALAGFKLLGEDTASGSSPSEGHGCAGAPASACVGMGGSFVGLLLGGMLGAVTASYLDGKYFAAYERPARTWAPNIAPVRGGVSLGVSGSF